MYFHNSPNFSIEWVKEFPDENWKWSVLITKYNIKKYKINAMLSCMKEYNAVITIENWWYWNSPKLIHKRKMYKTFGAINYLPDVSDNFLFAKSHFANVQKKSFELAKSHFAKV